MIVDGFQFASPAVSDVYCLTHFHADHYTSLHAKTWRHGLIYCSEVTARLVSLHLGFKGPLSSRRHLLISGTGGDSSSSSSKQQQAVREPGAALSEATEDRRPSHASGGLERPQVGR